MVKDPKEVVQEIVAAVGRAKARELLERQKINESTAEKLVGGRYVSAVGFLLHQKIERARAALDKQSA